MCSGAAATASCATLGAGTRMTPASPAPAPGWSSSRPRRTTAAGAPPPASRCSRWTSGVILTFYNHHNTGGGRVQADRVRGPGVCEYLYYLHHVVMVPRPSPCAAPASPARRTLTLEPRSACPCLTQTVSRGSSRFIKDT